jgi:hypothetical protein
MQKDPNKIAVELDPVQIVALIGKCYNEFVQNAETLFPGEGREFVRLLVNKRDRLYHDFEISKRNTDKKRLITAPCEILKCLQKGLSKLVAEQFENHDISHGFVKGRSTRTAAEALKKVGNIIEKETTNIDVQGAFPAISGRVIRKMLRHDSKIEFTNWQIVILSKIATRENDKLSTGAPSSPVIFNWRLTSFDKEISAAAKKRGWSIVRYADDISVVHYRTQKREAIELVKRMLEPLGLEIERRKLKTYKSGYIAALGLVITDNNIRIRRSARRKMRGLANRFRGKCLEAAQNIYTHRDAGEIRRRLPEKFAGMKHSVTATLAGYCAYLIGIDRPVKTQF